MKSKLKVGYREGPPEYPCLLRWKKNGSVVFMFRESRGVVVVPGEGDKIGDYSEIWNNNMDLWEYLHPHDVVELRNEEG